MTSDRYAARQRFFQEEMEIFDALPSAIREAIAEAGTPTRSRVVLDALLRGVDEATIIATIKRYK